jgi:hypothetical protein
MDIIVIKIIYEKGGKYETANHINKKSLNSRRNIAIYGNDTIVGNGG